MGTFSFREHLSEYDILERQMGSILAAGKTKFQHYMFWESPLHGTCLSLDGDLQSTQADVHTYHEALVHPAMLLHPNPRRVLICGGGEGATAREILRHSCVEQVVMCDLDQEFVDLCRSIIPDWAGGAFEDPRLEVRYEDILQYIANSGQTFDVIIGDLVDLAGDNPQVRELYGTSFFGALRKHMAPEGIMATQASALHPADHLRHREIRTNLSETFGDVTSYLTHIPSFYAPWGFVLANLAPLSPQYYLDLLQLRIQQRNLTLEAFDAASLAATFFLPPLIRKLLKD